LLQTSFLPDLIQVNLKPAETWVWLSFVH
jgi:hypothetical protein